MKNYRTLWMLIIVIFQLIIMGCQNREINPYESHEETYSYLSLEGIEPHFQRIWIDEMEYLILERDRNNPHEGFGFMALKGNKLINKQDSLIAYIQTSMETQAEILAILKNSSIEAERQEIQNRLMSNLASKNFLLEK